MSFEIFFGISLFLYGLFLFKIGIRETIKWFRLRKFEKEYAKTESANSNIAEESVTGGVAGYQTPNAFNDKKVENKMESCSKDIG